MLDFLFLEDGPVIARLDYTMAFEQGHRHATGSIVLRTFLLDENPMEDEGVYIDTFSFQGELITP